ncbi:MAG: BTAD domain-containing putative transcriptional regulator [Kiloniellaceae bacterium]
MTQGLRLHLFGGFHLKDANGKTISVPLRKGEALLGYLATAVGQSASREKLASLLWGESDQQRARQSLRQVLFALTRELTEHDIPVLRMENQLVSLDSTAIFVDTVEFESLIAEGSPDALARATALYQGEFLADLSIDASDFEEWLTTLRGRFQDLAIKAFLDLLDYQESSGQIDAAIKTAGQALRVDPFREDIHRQLMRLFVAKGMRSSALAQYRACQAVLQRELGVAPDQETTDLYRRIIDQGPLDSGDWAEPAGGSIASRSAASPAHDSRQVVARSKGISVGRGDELGVLNHCLARVIRGRCHFAAVIGEAGVGKSYLIDSFASGVADDDALVLTLDARQADERSSLGLLVDLLDLAAVRENLGALDDLSAAARQELARFKSGHGGLQEWTGAETDRRQLYDAVTEWLGALAGKKPLIVILDDLHRADDDSLHLLFNVVPELGDAPVLFLGTARSEDLERRPLLKDILEDLEGGKLLTLIALRPLSRDETAELLQRLQRNLGVKAEPRAQLDQVWELSEGNPRMILETLLANAARERAGRYGVAEPPDQVFKDVSRLLLLLSEQARRLAVVASVIGHRVNDSVLSYAAELDEEEMVRGVEELAAAQVLTADGDDLVFTRSRVRAALYDDLIPARRKALHAGVAQAIEYVHADALEPHYQTLAYHYRKAGRLFEALEFELRSALVEMNRGMLGSARTPFRRALETARTLEGQRKAQPLEIDACLGLAEVAELEQDLESALAHLRAVEVLLDQIGSARQRATLLFALARIHYMQGKPDAAYEYARRAMAESGREGGECLWLPPERLIGRLHLANGAYGRIVDHLVRRQQRCQSLGLRVEEADATATLGLLHATQGNFNLAFAQSEDAIRLAESLANERYLAAFLQFLGMVQSWHGDLELALANFDKAADMAEARGDLLRLYGLWGHRGSALFGGDRYGEAIEALKRAVDMAARLNTRFCLPLFKGWLAEASYEIGKHEDALHISRAAFHLAAETNQPWARSVVLRALARVLAHPEVRDYQGAEKAIRSALADQHSLGFRFERARSLIVHAKIARAAGDVGRSSQIYSEASNMFRQMEMAYDSDRARHMAEALRPAQGSG